VRGERGTATFSGGPGALEWAAPKPFQWGQIVPEKNPFNRNQYGQNREKLPKNLKTVGTQKRFYNLN